MYESEAFVRGILQIPLVEEMKAKLSCEASFKFNSTQLNLTLLSSAQLDLKIS